MKADRRFRLQAGERPGTVRAGTAARAHAVSALLAGVLAAGAAWARAPEVVVEPGGSGCTVVGTFQVAVSKDTAWAVLTDYERIGTFVRSVRASRIERRDADSLLLRQDAVGGVFLFRRRVQVLLDVREEYGRRISFRDVSGKDFERYVGEWTLIADSTGTEVRYRLEADPRTPMPRSLCRGMLKGVARDLLREVRDEMQRRGGEP